MAIARFDDGQIEAFKSQWPCSTCGESVARNDDVDCRKHRCCVDCSWEARAYGRSTGNYCLSCLREAVKRERNVWAMPWNGAWQASWHAGVCPFALCHRTEAHQHLIAVDRAAQI